MERSGRDLRGFPRMSCTGRPRGNRKKRHFAEKHSRSLLLKVPKAPAQSWGMMVKGRAERTWRSFGGEEGI